MKNTGTSTWPALGRPGWICKVQPSWALNTSHQFFFYDAVAPGATDTQVFTMPASDLPSQTGTFSAEIWTYRPNSPTTSYIFYGMEGNPKTVRFTVLPMLTVSPATRTVGFAGGATTFAVAHTGGGSMSYAASESVPWLRITDGASGGNSGTLAISCEANFGATARTGTITVSASGNIVGTPKTVKIVQSANPLDVTPSGRTYSAAGANGHPISVRASVAWTASSSAEWIAIASSASGSGNGTLIYNVASNGGAIRSGTITVSGSGINCTFRVHQWTRASMPGVSAEGDFDGDARADMVVYNPASGNWAFSFSTGPGWTLPWGWSATVPVPADYDGDGTTDSAGYHPASGNWYILKSSDGQMLQQAHGFSTAIPVPADYDGDGQADIAVLHRGTGTWRIKYSGGGGLYKQFGWSATIPVAADYDGDGAADLAVYHPATGNWYILKSTTGGTLVRNWGGSSAKPTLLYPLIHSWFNLP